MELHRVESASRIFHGRHRTVVRMCGDLKASRGLRDVVGVAHPAGRSLRSIACHSLEQLGAGLNSIQLYFGVAVLADGGRLHLAAQFMCHELRSVADAQHRDPQPEQGFVASRRIVCIDAVGPSCQDDSLRVHGQDLSRRLCIGMDLAINVAFSDSSRDQLLVLSAKVQDYDQFSVHRSAPFIMCQVCQGDVSGDTKCVTGYVPLTHF